MPTLNEITQALNWTSLRSFVFTFEPESFFDRVHYFCGLLILSSI